MKKLMIAAAIVCAAAVSQAAAINWTTTGAVAAPDTSKGIAYETHYGLSTTKAKAWFDGTTLAKIVLTHGTAGTEGYWTEEKTVNVVWGGTGKAAASNVNFENIVLTSAGDSCSYSITLTGYKTSGETTYAFTSDAITGTFKYSSASSTLSSGVPTGWDTGAKPEPPEPTPEPTSALLMLVGVAGLALRRKQK